MLLAESIGVETVIYYIGSIIDYIYNYTRYIYNQCYYGTAAITCAILFEWKLFMIPKW